MRPQVRFSSPRTLAASPLDVNRRRSAGSNPEPTYDRWGLLDSRSSEVHRARRGGLVGIVRAAAAVSASSLSIVTRIAVSVVSTRVSASIWFRSHRSLDRKASRAYAAAIALNTSVTAATARATQATKLVARLQLALAHLQHDVVTRRSPISGDLRQPSLDLARGRPEGEPVGQVNHGWTSSLRQERARSR
jgi:hypothetical protein